MPPWVAKVARAFAERPWVPAGLGAAVFALWAVLPAPGRWIAGIQYLDAMGTHWFYWYAEQAVFGDEALERSQLLFYPYGKDIYLHTGGNLLDAYLALPLRALLGHVAGYNAALGLILLLNAWGAARLARAYGANALGQGVAAVAISLNPYVLTELDEGRPTQALLAFIPLGLAFLVERRAVLAGVCLALSGYTYWYYGLLAGLAAALSGGFALALDEDRWAVTRTWGLAALVCVAVVLPGAWPMLSSVESGGVPGLLLYDGAGPLGGLHLRTAEGDPQGLFVQTLSGYSASYMPLPEGPSSVLGPRLFHPLQLLAAGFALLAGWRRAAPMLSVASLALLVGVGPVFWFGGPDNPLYQALLTSLPFVKRWWWPMRASALLHVSLAVLVGVAVSQLATRLSAYLAQRRPSGLLRAALSLLLLPVFLAWSGGMAPLHRWSAEVSPLVSECLAEAPAGAVIDLPLAWDQFHLYHQVWHGKPQMGGMLSRKAAFGVGAIEELLAGNDFARLIVDWGDRKLARPPELDEAGRRALIDSGYRYVLLRHEALRRELSDGRVKDDGPRVVRLISKVLGPPAGQDREGDHPVTLWTLDRSGWRCANEGTP